MTTEITKTNPEGESSIYQSTESFEFAQRQAKSLCESDLVPTNYKGQKGLSNCLVALEMSKRMNLSPLTVMQNLNVIHGKPSWSSQFITSNILGCGRFKNFDYIVTGSTKNDLLNHIVKDRLGKDIPVSEFKRSLEPLLDAKFYSQVVMMDGDEWCNYKFGPGSVHLSPQDKPTAMCVQKIEQDLGVSAWEVLVDDKVREKLNNMLQERN